MTVDEVRCDENLFKFPTHKFFRHVDPLMVSALFFLQYAKQPRQKMSKFLLLLLNIPPIRKVRAHRGPQLASFIASSKHIKTFQNLAHFLTLTSLASVESMRKCLYRLEGELQSTFLRLPCLLAPSNVSSSCVEIKSKESVSSGVELLTYLSSSESQARKNYTREAIWV